MIHSILLSDSLRKIPIRTKINLASLRAAHPGVAHGLYTGETLRDFVLLHFDRDIARAYELGSFASKTELGLYCLLFQLGGVYSDPSLYFFDPLICMPSDKLQVFRNASFGESCRISSSLIAATPKLPLFETCIKTFVERARQNDAGDACAPAGSGLFGVALELELTRSIRLADIAWGEEITLPGRNGANRCAYKAPAGNFVALNQNCARGGCAAKGAMAPEEEELLALLSIIDANI